MASRAYAIARDNFLFNTLDDTELTALMSAVKVLSFATGAVIVREGDVADELFLVVDGGVNVVKRGGQFLAYLGRGGFFGEMALFTSSLRRTADCVAADATVCVVIGASVLATYCDTHPASGLKVYRSIIRVLSERLQATSSDLAMLMSTQAHPQDDVDKWVAKAKGENARAK